MTPDNENLPRHVMDYLREDMRINPPRRAQDFDSMPQYRADLRAKRAAQDARLDRWLRTWGRWALIAAFAAGLILLASHAAPIAAHHIAHPATIQH